MSNDIGRYYPSSARGNVPLRRVPAQIVETGIEDAIQRLGVATSNVYDNISIFSAYWGSDDSGGDKDSSLFIETIQKLQNVDAHKCVLSQTYCDMELCHDVFIALPPRTSSRKLFIFHYAGHGIPGTTFITPKIGQKLDKGPELDLSSLKDLLKAEASFQGLDVLFVVDSRFTPIEVNGWGSMAKGARVESVAGTARRGVTNSDGRTFTEHWCAAFNKLLDTGKSFTSQDIVRNINSDSELEQFPSLLVLLEGWDLPITFSLHPNTIQSSFSSVLTSQTAVTVLYVEENPDSSSVKQLIEYFNYTSVPIKVLGTLPESGTLLLLRMSVFLQELLKGSRVAFMLEDESYQKVSFIVHITLYDSLNRNTFIEHYPLLSPLLVCAATYVFYPTSE